MRVGITTTAGGPLPGSANMNFTSTNLYGITGPPVNATLPVTLSATIYKYAGASTLTTPVSLPSVHVGDTFASQPVQVGNTTAMVTVGGGTYSESLYADTGSSNVTVVAGGTSSLSVPFADHTGAAGTVSIGTPVVFTSLHVPGSTPLVDTYGPTSGRTNLQTQTVTGTGSVYAYAGASTLTTPVSLPSVHVGDTFASQPVQVGNTTAMVTVGGGTYSESLYADTGSSNVTVVAGGTSSLLVPFADHTGAAGTVSIGTPVVFTSKAVPGSGLTDTYGPTSGRTNLQTQTVSGTGGVYAYAGASTLATPVGLGKVFVGGNFSAQPVALSNTTAMVTVGVNTYSESLNASSGCSNVTIPAGGSDNVLVCINGNTATAGSVSVGVPVVFTSKAVPGSGLSDTYGPTSGRTDLQTQTVTCTGTVWDHGDAALSTDDAKDITITLVGGRGDTLTQAYNVYNLTQTPNYTGGLDLTSVIATGDVDKIGSGLPASFRNLAEDTSNSYTASVDTSAVGTYSATYTLTLTDASDDGIAGDTVTQTLTVTVNAQVVPEPLTIILLAVALMGVVAYVRRRR